MDEVWDSYLQTFHKNITHHPKTEKLIRFSNGVPLRFFTLDNFDAVRPYEFGIHIYDEAAFAPNLKEARDGAISATGFKMKADEWYLSTPNGDNEFKRIAEHAQTHDDWNYYHYTTYDNPHIPRESIERFKEGMPSVMFRQEVMAEFITLQGNRIKREWLRYAEAPEGCTYFVGVDLAISKKTAADYTTMVVVGAKDNRYYVVDVLRMKESFNEVLTAIKNLAEKWKPNKIVIESVAYQAAMVQELVRTTNLPVKPITPSKDKITRFLHVEGKYEHGYIYHTQGLIPEYERELLSFPNAEHDDMCDALCYAVTTRQAQGFF